MKKLTLKAIYVYEVEINEDDAIVKEYESEKELIDDIASYRFGTGLPVIGGGGVKITDIEFVSCTKQ